MLRTLNSDHLQVVEGSKRLALSALVTVNRFQGASFKRPILHITSISISEFCIERFIVLFGRVGGVLLFGRDDCPPSILKPSSLEPPTRPQP